MKNLRSYPTPISGLTLGIAGAAFFWSVLCPAWAEPILIVAFALVLLLLAPLVAKFIRYPRVLLDELKHPTVGSVVPTFAMTLMLLVHTVQPWDLAVAIVLWLVAVALHLSFFALFLWHRCHDRGFEKVLPSWFIPPIGLVTACLTVPTPALQPVASILLHFGLAAYFIMLPLVLYRLFLHERIDELRKPSFAVLAAPPNLCLAGYLTLMAHPDPLLTLLLGSFAIMMTLSVYVMLSHLVRLPFNPAMSAFTFPLVIGARAMQNLSGWMHAQPLFQSYASGVHDLALVQAVIALLMIVFVTVKYCKYLHHHHFTIL